MLDAAEEYFVNLDETDNSACRFVGTTFVRTLRSGQSWDVAVREATKAVDTAAKDRSGIADCFKPQKNGKVDSMKIDLTILLSDIMMKYC